MARPARRPLRVALLGIKCRPAAAGADRVVEKLLEAFEGDDHDYTVYLMKEPGKPRLSCAGNLHYVYVPYLPGKHLGAFSYFLLCAGHALVKGRYDLVHVHNSDFGCFCPILRFNPRARLLGTFHGDPYLREKWGRVARLFLRFSERVFVECCHGLTSVSRFKARARGLVRTKDVVYVPNGVDAYWDVRLEHRFDFVEAGIEPGRYVLFACGRLDATKGLHHLLEAYAGSASREKLFVVGDFSHDAAYSARIRELAAKDPRVVLHPSLLDRTRLIDVLRSCRYFVFPSDVEAMSMMLLEAISCKRLVVCSDIPENRAVVGDDHPFLFPAGHAAHLRAMLERAERSASESAPPPIVEALYHRCLVEFSWTSIAETYHDTYAGMSPAQGNA